MTWLALAGFLAVTFLAAAFGAQFTPGAWYEALRKPAWTPPGAVFGPVWTALYVAMAVAAWLVWRERGFAGARLALAAYGAQLVLNAAWSWLFFGAQRVGLALIDIVALLALIALTMVLFWRVRTAAGLLFLPYVAWVAFASALNAAIFALNR